MSPETRRVGLMRNSRVKHTRALLSQYYPDLVVLDIEKVSGLDQVDFVLAGGGKDIDPTLYGEADRACKPFDPEQDQLDLDLLQSVMKRGLPFLGLCRGAQLLNVALGGTLHQDLLEDTGSQHPQWHTITYDHCVAPHFTGLNEVNSTHHQGVAQVAESLTVLASAQDGLPELWWQPGAIGTQFHPESLIHEDARWQLLFDWWLSGASSLPNHLSTQE